MSFSISSFRKTADLVAMRPVNRYLVWCSAIASATFVSTWLYVIWMPMAFLNFDYPLWLTKKSMIEACDLGAMVVFGDSRAESALIPTLMPVKASNLAMSGTSPIETYFTVERALRCTDRPKLVVIAHGVIQFDEDPDFWDDAPVFGLINYQALREIEKQATRLADRQVFGAKDAEQSPAWLRDWLYRVRFPPLFFPYIINNHVAGEWWKNKKVFAVSGASRGQAIFGDGSESHNLADEFKLKKFRASPLEDYYFTKTLSLLRSQNIQTVFLTIPINQSTYNELDHAVEVGFSTYLRAKEQQFPNLHVVGDIMTCWPDEFFGDAFHLNTRGAEAYSRQIANWLKQNPTDLNSELPDRCVRPSRHS